MVAPDDERHLAWRGARALQRSIGQRGIELSATSAPLTTTADRQPDLLLMPLRSLASRVAAFEVLELPFFYPSLGAVHANIDGALGKHLGEAAAAAGLHLAAVWDDGMHRIAGLKRFGWVRNLKAREFLFTRDDPVAERAFTAWRADVRRIDARDRETVLRECLIANRATTPAEAVHEQLYRVHLSLSATEHRYEGWVVVSPLERWNGLPQATRDALQQSLMAIHDWQRNDAQSGTRQALDTLLGQGMIVYELDEAERAAFVNALPGWQALLSDTLSTAQKNALIDLASAGTAAFVAGSGASTPGDHPPPGTERHEADHQQAGDQAGHRPDGRL